MKSHSKRTQRSYDWRGDKHVGTSGSLVTLKTATFGGSWRLTETQDELEETGNADDTIDEP